MAADVRAALAAALRAALGARDMAAAAALRSALAAIANAEMPRRVLDEATIRHIVTGEITERRQAADQYANTGHVSYANRLTAAANVLQAVLAATPAASQRRPR